jgi:hypothetical protein
MAFYGVLFSYVYVTVICYSDNSANLMKAMLNRLTSIFSHLPVLSRKSPRLHDPEMREFME